MTQPIDVRTMLRRASNRVSLRSLLHARRDRHMHVLSRPLLDKLISQAIADTIRRLKDEGAMALALTEARLATEARKELQMILARMSQPAPSPADEEIFFADEEEDDRRVAPFEGADVNPGRGLDLGSVNVRACAWSKSKGKILFNVQRNAFLDVRADGFTQSLLRKFGVECLVRGDRAYVVGDPAFELATVFDKTLRRPTEEPEGALVVGHLLELILGRAGKPGEICVYSLPGEPVDADRDFIYHQAVLEQALRTLGYAPQPMVESHAIIQSEFRDQGYTGIGITCGGSGFNVCVACKGLPALAFSTSRGGEWVDRNVAKALGLPAAQVCAVKERGMDLSQPKDQVEGAIAIYYRRLLQDTLETIQRKVGAADSVPAFGSPIDIVCAGGAALIGGFVGMFREELAKVALPMAIGQVRLARSPMEAVAAGCLRAAVEETRALEESPMLTSPAVTDRAPMTTAASVPRPLRLRPAA